MEFVHASLVIVVEIVQDSQWRWLKQARAEYIFTTMQRKRQTIRKLLGKAAETRKLLFGRNTESEMISIECRIVDGGNGGGGSDSEGDSNGGLFSIFSPKSKNQSTENHKHTANRFLYFFFHFIGHRHNNAHNTQRLGNRNNHTHTHDRKHRWQSQPFIMGFYWSRSIVQMLNANHHHCAGKYFAHSSLRYFGKTAQTIRSCFISSHTTH